MGDLQHLVRAKKADRMGPGLGAAPDGVDADLLLRPLAADTLAGVYSLLGSMASSSIFAVPLGASTFWL